MIIEMLSILSTIKNVYKFIKNHFNYFLIGLLILLGSIIYLQKGTIKRQDTEIGSLNNNLIEYASSVNGLSTEKRVLQLKLSDLSNSRDKDIQTIDSLSKALKIAPKTIHSVTHIETLVHDTISGVIAQDSTSCDFIKVLDYNKETKIEVIKKDSLLTVIPTITNSSDLFVITKRVYRNKRSNWFSRLIHWDWKKDNIKKYELHNSNDIIQVKNIKVIEVEQ